MLDTTLARLHGVIVAASIAVEGFYKSHTGVLAIVAIVLAALQLISAKRRNRTPELRASPKAAFDQDDRRTLLDRVQRERIDTRLHQGLRDALRVDLQLVETPRAVPSKLRAYGEREFGYPTDRLLDHTIERVFEGEAARRLLILGEPGTGKTNLLLELAESLVKRARVDPASPIPVVFSLARWTLRERNRPLAEWMIDDLDELYGVSRAAAQVLVEENRVLPLLDGLDEVIENRRNECVDSIVEYQRARNSGPIAVCCRIEEYNRLTPKLAFGSAIRVEPLSHADVDREIARLGLRKVAAVLASDAELRALVNTPLWLHVLYLAVQSNTEWSNSLDVRDRLYDKFVSYALRRSEGDEPSSRTPDGQFLTWVTWLAERMQQDNQADFALEDLTLAWLTRTQLVPAVDAAVSGIPDRRSELRVAQRLLFAVAVGVLATIVGGRAFGILAGLLAGIRFQGRVEPAKDLRFSWSDALVHLRVGIGYGAIFGVTFAISSGAVGGICVCLLAAVFEALQGGLRPRSVARAVSPNGETLRSVSYAMRTMLAAVVVAAASVAASVAGVSHGWWGPQAYDACVRAGSWIVFAGIVLAGEKGGWFALRHYYMRVRLWRSGFAPFSYVSFLDECVARLFLVRRGGSYEFLHLTFRDYLANRHRYNGVAAPRLAFVGMPGRQRRTTPALRVTWAIQRDRGAPRLRSFGAPVPPMAATSFGLHAPCSTAAS